MKVRFVGNPNARDEQKVCEMFGKTFFRDVDTDVSDLSDAVRRKIAGNNHFLVVEGERRKPGRPRKEVAHVEDEGADEPSSSGADEGDRLGADG